MRRYATAIIFLSLLVLLFTTVVPGAFGARIAGQDPRGTSRPGQRMVTIDFDNVDIRLFVKWIAELTGKNFVLDNRVKGAVTIISPTKISVDEAYQVFLSVLEVHGYTTVEAGDVTKIVPSPNARGMNVETLTHESRRQPEDRVVTQIVPLRYANADDIKKLFQPLITKSSIIVSYAPTNTLIITDVQSNISRLLKIIKVIDVTGVGEEVAVVPLSHAKADELVKILSTVFADKAKTSRRRPGQEDVLKLVADERTNVVVILASEEDTRRIKQLIAYLDQPVPRGKGRIHVYYLQNATAEEVAKVLENLSTTQTAAKQGEAPLISKDVKISADKPTNSLIIMAEQEEYLVLEEVIHKLDIPRSMVYIEALIMEVTEDKNFEVGVEWRAADDFTAEGAQAAYFMGSGGGGTEGAYQIFPSPQTVGDQAYLPFPSAFSLGVVGEYIEIGDMVFDNIGAVIRAYKSDSDVHILSAPQLLTTNNEEAEIVVGKNVPYVTKKETSSSDLDYSTYEYKDVGLTLKITPSISQERLVRLDVFQELTRLIEQSGTTTEPTTYKRSTDTTIIVKDGHTIVIGGLIDESTEGGTTKVPCLGDLWGVGWLFRSEVEKREKTNLYVFLTPHIIENPDEAREIFEDKKEEIRAIEAGTIKMYKRTGGVAETFDEWVIRKEEARKPVEVMDPAAVEEAAREGRPESDAEAPIEDVKAMDDDLPPETTPTAEPAPDAESEPAAQGNP